MTVPNPYVLRAELEQAKADRDRYRQALPPGYWKRISVPNEAARFGFPADPSDADKHITFDGSVWAFDFTGWEQVSGPTDLDELKTELAETERERVRLRDLERKTAAEVERWKAECEKANRRAGEAQQAQKYWREQAMDDVDRLNVISEIEPDATNPAHWRWAAELLGPTVWLGNPLALQAHAARLEREQQQQADATEELIEKTAREMYAADSSFAGVGWDEAQGIDRTRHLYRARRLHAAGYLRGGGEK
ncbi:hypothetical protein ACPXB3_22080 [Gordonia sp. DT219]|uniref:hypothetical protein n=1 Tax=Gordonia sp. DT219 TaxID=3416658 RepID=UPI003CEDCC5C